MHKAVVALSLAIVSFGLFAQGPRVAIVGGTDRRHANEFDLATSKLGWTINERFISTPQSMKELANKLDKFDLLLFTPLFNYRSNPMVLPGDDRGAFMKFLEKGGMIVVTDGSYAEVRKWISDLDPRFAGLQPGNCNSSQWNVAGQTIDADPPHPLRFFPWKIGENNSWAHMQKLPKDSKWQLVASCNEGYPVSLMQRIGKGIFYFASIRQTNEKQLDNFFANLQMSRAGIELKSFSMKPPALGDGKIVAEFKGEINGTRELVYTVTNEKGKSVQFVGKNEGNAIEVPYNLSFRGPVVETLALRYDGKEELLFSRNSKLPQLLTLRQNAYRGILSTKRRVNVVRFGVELEPDKEDIREGRIDFSVFYDGKAKVYTDTLKLSSNVIRRINHPLALEKSLPAGDYTLKATLHNKHGRYLANAETSFKILAPRAAQTIIDDDGTFLVNGLPFFPLGIYHISPDDFREAKRMGLNTVQFWAWHGIADKYGIYPHISSASANGLKLLLELNHRSKEVVREKAEQFRDNPAFLMWYSVDELSESGYSEAQMMKDTFHEFDDNHPVYSLSCRPDAFAEQSEYCDVFAIDPYGDTKRVLDWTTNAYAAVEGKKPLVVVPASFANSKPEVYRSQLYVSLASGARGVIWYPWSQAGGGPLGVGLKNHPEAQNVVSQLCSEVNMMLPSLTRVDRRLFASDCGSIRALSMHEGWGITLLLVNATDKPVKAKMKIPNFEKDNRDLRDFFKKDSKPELKIVGGEFEIELKPFETRVFSR